MDDRVADLRPCVFCSHPVPEDALDEYDCPVCGDPWSRPPSR
ncbi:hypothetical protein [Kitasatospora phosalacinea]|nr:hypothetical protein [Kitasatospora phosalacinea]